MCKSIDLRNHGNLPRALDERRDIIISLLSNHLLEQNTLGVEIIYSSCKGEIKTVKCNYYVKDGWFFA